MVASTYQVASRQLLRQGREELAKGDTRQAAEKGWGAAAQIVKAIAESRGLPTADTGSSSPLSSIFAMRQVTRRLVGCSMWLTAFTTTSTRTTKKLISCVRPWTTWSGCGQGRAAIPAGIDPSVAIPDDPFGSHNIAYVNPANFVKWSLCKPNRVVNQAPVSLQIWQSPVQWLACIPD